VAGAGHGARAARADRLCRQPQAVGAGAISRWAETFAALSGGTDNLDTLRHNDEPSFSLSHSVQSVTGGGYRRRR
jgi:hypothetical protein